MNRQRAPRRDPAPRPRAGALDAGRARRRAARGRPRRRADDDLARHPRARPRQGAQRRGPPRLRAARHGRPRAAATRSPPRSSAGRSPASRAATCSSSRRRPASPARSRRRSTSPAHPQDRRHDRRREHGPPRRARAGHRRRARGRDPTAHPLERSRMTRTAVLAFSGGLDTTCAIAWLKEDYGFDEVVAVLVDVGQAFDLEESIARGRAAGAADILLVDRKEAFAERGRGPRAEDERAVRGPLPARLRALAPGDRRGRRRDRGGARRRGGRARLHRQGQRPAALRARVQGDLPGRAGDRAAARPRLGARGRGRVRDRARDPGRADRRVAVLDRREPARPLDRGRRARGPVGRAARGAVRSSRRARRRGARAGGGRDRLRAGRSRCRSTASELPLAELIAGAERARRRLRDRADRHDREPRGRHQEPRGVRGAGRDRADRGAPGARGSRAHEGRAAHEARARDALDGARLRRPLVQPAARRDRRVRRRDAGGRDGRGAAARCSPGRRSSPAAARSSALYSETLASYGAGETFPHEAAEGFIKISSLETELLAPCSGDGRSHEPLSPVERSAGSAPWEKSAHNRHTFVSVRR